MADERVSGSTLDRPGLQDALRMLQRGRANTLVVVKLDRLTRSVRDLCLLVDDYFAQDRYHLLSICGMANTHSAAGRMLMLNLAHFAQFEREIIDTAVAVIPLSDEKVRLRALVLLCCVAVVFWLAMQQTGTSLALFAQDHTLQSFAVLRWRALLRPGHFAALHAGLVIGLLPLLLGTMGLLRTRKAEISTPEKMVWGFRSRNASLARRMDWQHRIH